MKLYVFLFVLLIVLVQIYSSYAELTEGSSNSDNLEQLSKRKITGLWDKRLSKQWGKRLMSQWGKRLSSQWGKRLSSQWGKRSESESDDLNQHILRELYHTVRLNQLTNPRYSVDDDYPLTLEQLIAQRTTWNDDNENMS